MLVFGLRAIDVDEVADQLAALLSWPFEKRNSSYIGDYCLHEEGDREVKVRFNRDPFYKPNVDPPEDRYCEPSHPDCPVVIHATLSLAERATFEAALKECFPDAVFVGERIFGPK